MESELLWILAPVFAVIAFVYGSVGLGGGSSYVAVMALLSLDHTQIPMVALGLNLVVASGGFVQFARAGHFQMRTFLLLAVASAPAAYFFAQVPVSSAEFQLILGLLLLVAGLRMAFNRWFQRGEVKTRRPSWWLLLGLGAVLGAAAGLTGIGGGVYLAPLLLLTGSARPKQAAALASGVVLVNSVSGIAGRVAAGAVMPWAFFLPLALVVFVAGQVGAYGGAHRFKQVTVQTTFGVLVILVSVRLLGGIF